MAVASDMSEKVIFIVSSYIIFLVSFLQRIFNQELEKPTNFIVQTSVAIFMTILLQLMVYIMIPSSIPPSSIMSQKGYLWISCMISWRVPFNMK